jgi:uracil-DNA glycosylase
MAFFERAAKKSTSVRRRSLTAACVQCTRKADTKDKEGNIISCKGYSIPVSGKGKKKILLIRDQPTSYIDATGSWFATSENKSSFIQTILRDADIELRQDCWMTGAALCYKVGASLLLAIESCLPNLASTVRELQPKLIIPMGERATYAVLSALWRDGNIGDMSRFFGWQIPAKQWNAWICPVYDSAYIMSLGYTNPNKPNTPTGAGVAAYFWLKQHINEALKKLEEPPPDDQQTVSIQFLYDAVTISEILKHIGNYDKGYAIFDYETNCLKPETKGAKVLCASVCFGGWNKVWKCIAFPMLNDTIPVWKQFLQSPIPKIAHNCKFEDRWSNVYFETSVNNWFGDTMLNVHILDCRQGISGLKFQTSVNFGVIGYEDATKPYMSGGVGKLNRLHEIPVETLLKYCGYDSFYTWRLFVKQMRQLGQIPYWKLKK